MHELFLSLEELNRYYFYRILLSILFFQFYAIINFLMKLKSLKKIQQPKEQVFKFKNFALINQFILLMVEIF